MADERERKILAEVVEKVGSYEKRASSFMSEIAEWTDMWRIKPHARRSGSFSNPRTTEFFRACNSLSILMYRMLTAQEPFFKIFPMDPAAGYEDVRNLESVLNQQMRAAKYKKYLLKACHYVVPFGTVIAEESWRTVGVNRFRNIPTTTFRPRVLDQIAFDTGAIEIDDASWISTQDVVTKGQLHELMRDAKEGKNRAWDVSALEDAINKDETSSTINQQVLDRLRRANPHDNHDEVIRRSGELIMYYGKLDTLNDGFEYVVGVYNRHTLVRFHANNFQHGRRQFRVGKWKDFTGQLGDGVGSLLGHEARSLDTTERATRDSHAFAAYNMWKIKRNSVLAEDLKIRPNNFIEVDDQNDITPMDTNSGAIGAGQTLLEFLQQNFRNAAGAPDELQAIASEAVTATQASLAQNSAQRNVAVVAEQFAEPMIKEHLEVMHANNSMLLRSPIDIERAGLAKRVYPRDINFDADFLAKTVTDKDYTPKRLTELQNLLMTLISTKSSHPDQMNISILPIVKEIAHQLNVNPDEVLQAPSAPAGFGQGELDDLGAGTLPPQGGEPTNEPVMDTPVGPTIVGP